MEQYKIYEIVLVDGQEATIRDIYHRAYRDSEGEIRLHTSYRMHEKQWQAQDVLPHRVQKLHGEMNFSLDVPKARKTPSIALHEVHI